MDNSTLNTDAIPLGAGFATPRHAAPRHAARSRIAPNLAAPSLAAPNLAAPSLAAPSLAAPSLAAPSLADEVRATLLLFGTVLLVILGFGLASTLVLRLLTS